MDTLLVPTAARVLTDKLPNVPAEEITAWYQHDNRNVSYTGGQYETDRIYERKYLDGSDQYAVFLNSHQQKEAHRTVCLFLLVGGFL